MKIYIVKKRSGEGGILKTSWDLGEAKAFAESEAKRAQEDMVIIGQDVTK